MKSLVASLLGILIGAIFVYASWVPTENTVVPTAVVAPVVVDIPETKEFIEWKNEKSKTKELRVLLDDLERNWGD